MRPVIEIDEPGDLRVVDYTALTDVALRTRREPAEGLFIAEGETVIRRAVRAGYRPRSLLVGPGRLATVPDEVGDAPVYLAGPAVLAAVTGFAVHRGALASMARRPLPAAADLLAAASRVAIFEDVVSHTNLGAAIRSAAALGVDAVLLSPRCCDPLYRRSIRVSMGAVFAVPYARLTPWPAALGDVHAAGFHLLGLTPTPNAVPLDRVDLRGRTKRALLLGTEGPGLSPTALRAADEHVRIPMSDGVDSLNVAAAAAVAFWVVGRG